MLNVKELDLSILRWGAFAGQPAFVLNLGGGEKSPLSRLMSAVDILSLVEGLGMSNVKHFRLSGGLPQADPDELYPLYRALQARGFSISALIPPEPYLAWYAHIPHKIVLMDRDSPKIIEAQEVWYQVLSVNEKEPDLGLLNPMRYAQIEPLDFSEWLARATKHWGILLGEDMHQSLQSLLPKRKKVKR